MCSRIFLAFTLLSVACSDKITSEEQAARAYLGLDAAVEKAMNLGMDGYNAATSANIPEQPSTGGVSGTITVTGQVDAGVSDNKELRLEVTLEDYADTVEDENDLDVAYDTAPDAPLALDISLRDLPNGTFDGTLVGEVEMDGDLEGNVTLDLEIGGDIEPDPDDPDAIRRVDGTTVVTGTAVSAYGTFEVDVER